MHGEDNLQKQRKIVDYHIVTSDNASIYGVEKPVKLYLGEGYIPIGGVSYSERHNVFINP